MAIGITALSYQLIEYKNTRKSFHKPCNYKQAYEA